MYRFNKFVVVVLVFACSLKSFAASTVPVIAPQNLVDMFVNSSGVAIPTTSYTNGTHSIFGNVQFLQSGARGYSTGTTTVQQRLQSSLYMSNKSLTTVTFAGIGHQRLSENGILPGQCVAFAKGMTNAPGTTGTWQRGNAISGLFPNGYTSTPSLVDGILRAGTMIAHFDGQTVYNSVKNTRPHVAIVLSVSVNASTGQILGLNMVDANSITSATINGVNTVVASGGSGTILKHFLPWSSISSDPRLSAKNYHVVNQCPS